MGENPSRRRANYGFAEDSITSFSLPNDIAMYVFLKLPVKSILRCKCVCKQWQHLLSDPEFARMHHNHSGNHQKLLLRSYFQSFYSIDYEGSEDNRNVAPRNFPLKSRCYARTLGSCNGLLCIAIDYKKKGRYKNYKIVLWNPSTGDYKMLPNANPLIDTNIIYSSHQLVGFGYDSFFGDYKMVRVIFRPRYQVDVYSLKSNSWKVSESAPLSRFGFSPNVIQTIGTVLNGSIYWLLEDRECGKFDRWIVGFDLKDDKFIELQLPPKHPHSCRTVKLMVMGGCLGIAHYSYWTMRTISGIFAVLWMMKEAKKDEWTKLTTIYSDESARMSSRLFSRKQPLCVLENGKVLLYKESFRSEIAREAIAVYDPKVKSIVQTIPLYHISSRHDLMTYVESLVSPNAWVAN